MKNLLQKFSLTKVLVVACLVNLNLTSTPPSATPPLPKLSDAQYSPEEQNVEIERSSWFDCAKSCALPVIGVVIVLGSLVAGGFKFKQSVDQFKQSEDKDEPFQQFIDGQPDKSSEENDIVAYWNQLIVDRCKDMNQDLLKIRTDILKQAIKEFGFKFKYEKIIINFCLKRIDQEEYWCEIIPRKQKQVLFAKDLAACRELIDEFRVLYLSNLAENDFPFTTKCVEIWNRQEMKNRYASFKLKYAPPMMEECYKEALEKFSSQRETSIKEFCDETNKYVNLLSDDGDNTDLKNLVKQRLDSVERRERYQLTKKHGEICGALERRKEDLDFLQINRSHKDAGRDLDYDVATNINKFYNATRHKRNLFCSLESKLDSVSQNNASKAYVYLNGERDWRSTGKFNCYVWLPPHLCKKYDPVAVDNFLWPPPSGKLCNLLIRLNPYNSYRHHKYHSRIKPIKTAEECREQKTD